MTATAAKNGHHLRKSALPDWRTYLTPAERADLAGLEANAQQLDARRRMLTHEMLLLRNRCLSRRRLALLKQAAEAAE